MKTTSGLVLLSLILYWMLRPVPSATSNAMERFLATLNEAQKEKVLLPLDDASRERWHYFPSSMWPRAGLSLGELSEPQAAALFGLLQASLSQSGYGKVRQIISLESVLRELGGNPRMRDPEAYWVAVYGNPSGSGPWAWSFEGHHLSLNFTIVDGQVAASPRFLGANPATILSGPRKGERTLAQEEDLGFELVNSLRPEQRQRAIIRRRAFPDILTANDSRVEPLPQEGLPARELEPEQRALLHRLLDEYLSVLPPTLAEARRKKIEREDAQALLFAWAGSTAPGRPHYYRIQGKTFLIEFDNTQNDANHIHTVWREFDGDFGRDLLREHYRRAPHHRR